jgi:Fungal specific transcription factor domain
MVTMFKFVDTDAETFDRKRKEPPQRACDACRRKKKRCTHGVDQENLPQQSSGFPPNSAPIPSSMPTQVTSLSDGSRNDGQSYSLDNPHQSASTMPQIPPNQFPSPSQPKEKQSTSRSRHPSSSMKDTRGIDSRFIGDMNPEGVFLAARSPQDLRGGPHEGNVGFWLAQQFDKSDRSRGQSRTAPPSSLFYGYTPAIQQVFLPILEGDCLSTLPPTVHREALCSTYLQKFHPIFPILDQSSYEMLPEQAPSRILLEQGMSLVACVDSSSKPHLLLADDDKLLGCKDFGRRILAAMKVSIETGVVSDKIILIQALALMSLFSEGREGADASSLMIGRAVQYLHSLGIHMPDRKEDPGLDYAETLFCCIWTIDRLNAAFQGRAILMHERDIGRSLQQCFDAQQPAFKLFLHVVELLDRVIGLYRPGNIRKELESDFSLFEDLILRCEAFNVPTNQLGE